MAVDRPATDEPTHEPADAAGSGPGRIVLLGASNLTRGISTVVETAQHLRGQPLEVFAALGHGRSYGRESTVFGRTLPGITQCRLWDALAARPPAATAALLTDVGNDLLYEASVDEIENWVATCLDRLLARRAAVVMTLLPMGSVEALGRWRFALLKKILFPRCTLDFDTVRTRAAELNARLRALGEARGVTLVAHARHWYGFDPIHIQRRHWPRAWNEILSAWSRVASAPLARGSWRRWLHLRTRRPLEYRLLGFRRRREQPCGRLADGSTVWLF